MPPPVRRSVLVLSVAFALVLAADGLRRQRRARAAGAGLAERADDPRRLLADPRRHRRHLRARDDGAAPLRRPLPQSRPAARGRGPADPRPHEPRARLDDGAGPAAGDHRRLRLREAERHRATSGLPADQAAASDEITVEGRQYYWQFLYPNGEISVDDLRLPYNRTVRLTIVSRDVIHSWWVPALGGKIDAIPGRRNHTWFRATKLGTFRGQCAELCGLQHAEMLAQVEVLPADEYDSLAATRARAPGRARQGDLRRRLREVPRPRRPGRLSARSSPAARCCRQPEALANVIRNGGTRCRRSARLVAAADGRDDRVPEEALRPGRSQRWRPGLSDRRSPRRLEARPRRRAG